MTLALVGETPAISGHWEEDRVDACPSHHQHQLHHRLPEGRDQALLVEDRMWRLGSLLRRFWQFDQTINSSHTVYIVVVAFELTRIVNKKVLTRIFWYTFSHLTHYEQITRVVLGFVRNAKDPVLISLGKILKWLEATWLDDDILTRWLIKFPHCCLISVVVAPISGRDWNCYWQQLHQTYNQHSDDHWSS